MPMWYHFACFFKKAKITATHEIKGFDCLRYDDQQKIKTKLGLETDQAQETASTSSTAASVTSNSANEIDVMKYFNF
jgi:hypothetical protein